MATRVEIIAKSEDFKAITKDFRTAVERYVSVSTSQVDTIRKATKNNGIEGDSTPDEIRKAVEIKLKDAEKQLANLTSLAIALKQAEEDYALIVNRLRSVTDV